MKFVISSSLLSQRLQTLGRVIPSKNSMPILDNFLFQVADGKLTVTASDNEVTLRTTVDLVESDGNLSFAINAKMLQDAMKEIPEQPLEFTINPEGLEIKLDFQNGHYSLVGQNADEYPVTKELEGEISTLVMDAQRMHSSVSRALFAAAEDPLRPVMNGVFFDYQSNGLAVVASDGRKLACSRLTDLKNETPTSFILHKKPANIMKGILQKEAGDATINFTKRNVTINTENYVLSARLIEGNFPNYNSVIPRENPHRVTVNRAAMISALRRLLIVSNAGSPLIKLHVEPSRMVLSTRDSDYGRAGEESMICEYEGVPMNIGFKGTLLMELLNNLESEEIVFQLADPARAGVIVPAEPTENEDILMLLMPMMLND